MILFLQVFKSKVHIHFAFASCLLPALSVSFSSSVYPDNIMVMKHLITRFSPASNHFHPSSSKYSPVFQHLCLCSSLHMRAQHLHSLFYSKIIFVSNLSIVHLDRGGNKENFGLRHNKQSFCYQFSYKILGTYKCGLSVEEVCFCVDKKKQLDVTFCVLYFSSNSCSTCFGQPCAHHQELTTA